MWEIESCFLFLVSHDAYGWTAHNGSALHGGDVFDLVWPLSTWSYGTKTGISHSHALAGTRDDRVQNFKLQTDPKFAEVRWVAWKVWNDCNTPGCARVQGWKTFSIEIKNARSSSRAWSLVIILTVSQPASFAFFFQNILKLSQTTKIPPSSTTSTKRSPPICSMWLGCSSVPPDQCAARAVFDGRRWPAESPGRSFSSGLNGALNWPDVTYHYSIVPKFRMMPNICY